MLMGIIWVEEERDSLVEAVRLNLQAGRSCKFSERVTGFAGSGWKLVTTFYKAKSALLSNTPRHLKVRAIAGRNRLPRLSQALDRDTPGHQSGCCSPGSSRECRSSLQRRTDGAWTRDRSTRSAGGPASARYLPPPGSPACDRGSGGSTRSAAW